MNFRSCQRRDAERSRAGGCFGGIVGSGNGGGSHLEEFGEEDGEVLVLHLAVGERGAAEVRLPRWRN